MGIMRAVGQAVKAFSAGADHFASKVGNQLWPQWQAGIQDANTLFTRMTLDQPGLATVPGQAGVSTQKELYDLAHPTPDQEQALKTWQQENVAAGPQAQEAAKAPEIGD